MDPTQEALIRKHLALGTFCRTMLTFSRTMLIGTPITRDVVRQVGDSDASGRQRGHGGGQDGHR